jgi:acetyl-CoA carboxylase biotin carboxyl carrier protein
MKRVELKDIRSLAQIMKDTGLTGLELVEEGKKIRLEKHMPPPVVSAAPPASGAGAPSAPPVQAEKSEKDQGLKEIKSPMVGVFYTSSSPESQPYIKVGSKVKKGDIVCIIEAMKLLNEINSDQDGEIAEICVDNGQVVEYGQTLFKLR